MQQHADCILPNGEPIGYFANDGAATGGPSSASWNVIHMNKTGVVLDYRKMKRTLPQFTNEKTAKAKNILSTVLLVDVNDVEARLFSTYWQELSQSSGSFHLLGKNCSTRASQAFIKAGILHSQIPGIDTPNNLYEQLAKEKSRNPTSFSGYIGFSQSASPGHLDLLIDKK